MNAMEKIKLSKERIQLIADLKAGNLKGLDKIKASKRVVEIVVLLGGQAEQPSNEQLSENDYIPEVWISEAKDSKYNESLLKNYKEWFDRDARKFILDNGFKASGDFAQYVGQFSFTAANGAKHIISIFVGLTSSNNGSISIYSSSSEKIGFGLDLYDHTLKRTTYRSR